jgi:Protein of unknown function (DUF1569)
MPAQIDTTRVAGRRTLRFNSLAEILADVETLARAQDVRAIGNWSPGQVVDHLATVMNKSIDGFTARPPGVVRFFLRLIFKKRLLARTMAPGFRLGRRMEEELVLPAVSLEVGVEHFRRAYQRLQTETPRSEHPAIGALTPAEWEQLHCRHAELHLGFLSCRAGAVAPD